MTERGIIVAVVAWRVFVCVCREDARVLEARQAEVAARAISLEQAKAETE